MKLPRVRFHLSTAVVLILEFTRVSHDFLIPILFAVAGSVSTFKLLAKVWGYRYFGGTRTVDIHVRRLRAKLGSPADAMIETVRNVGYKLVAPVATATPRSS